MLRCQFLCYVLKTLFFIEIALKLSYFCKKNAKCSRAGAPPSDPLASAARGFAPDPQPPAAESFTFRPPLAFGRWGLRPQTPELAPPLRICEFLATRLQALFMNNILDH